VTSISGGRTWLWSTGAVRGGRGGYWASAGDCESLGSCSDSVASSLPVNQQAGLSATTLPDVIILPQNDRPEVGRERRLRATVKMKEETSHQAVSNVSHSAR